MTKSQKKAQKGSNSTVGTIADSPSSTRRALRNKESQTTPTKKANKVSKSMSVTRSGSSYHKEINTETAICSTNPRSLKTVFECSNPDKVASRDDSSYSGSEDDVDEENENLVGNIVNCSSTGKKGRKKGKKNIDDDEEEEEEDDADSYFKLYEITAEQVTYVRTYVQNNLYPQAKFFMEKHVDFNSPHMAKALEIVQATDAVRLWKVSDGIKKLFRTTIETKQNYTVHRMQKFVTGKVLIMLIDADKKNYNLTIFFSVFQALLKKDKMFDLTLMKYFLDAEMFTDQDMQVFNANGSSIINSVQEAWFPLLIQNGGNKSTKIICGNGQVFLVLSRLRISF